ncbi:ABC transporter ATP-binding protein [Ktedonobacter sp. SOSP1-85]|uniref:DUF302 domain-containing protein n=1 Tax=Ktedonobacter sp. SOSP1-85 TaxID=2778367 RepID=UPI0019168C33|nr:DUF302 domain-containing protein [Ktedonobacter sp. SOSP1-85]GHO80181.1 ABC transporter ATP-binding protein [Ktedonobacter sp. SOSP1-85]
MEYVYGFGMALSGPYEDVVLRVKEALKAEGFGVLTEIDVQQTLSEKLGVQMPPYLILDVCNPHLAHRALELEPAIGLLLPCNVIVRTLGKECSVEVADPNALIDLSRNQQLTPIAEEAKQHLQRAIATLQEDRSAGSACAPSP